jgi:hypothetical protein
MDTIGKEVNYVGQVKGVLNFGAQNETMIFEFMNDIYWPLVHKSKGTPPQGPPISNGLFWGSWSLAIIKLWLEPYGL